AVLQRAERLGETDHRLGGAEHQEAVGLEHLGDAVEHADLGLLIEIDQHAAAEHDVEIAEMGEVAITVTVHSIDTAPLSRQDCVWLALHASSFPVSRTM